MKTQSSSVIVETDWSLMLDATFDFELDWYIMDVWHWREVYTHFFVLLFLIPVEFKEVKDQAVTERCNQPIHSCLLFRLTDELCRVDNGVNYLPHCFLFFSDSIVLSLCNSTRASGHLCGHSFGPEKLYRLAWFAILVCVCNFVFSTLPDD